MRVLFRADSSLIIGTGHVMRCLVLADELKKHNVHITFMCSDGEGNINEFINAKGYEIILINNKDQFDNSHCFFEEKVDWLIVDHYSLDESWERYASLYVEKVMVIDDLANRKHFCDLLLDQNLYIDLKGRYNNLVSKDCVKLLGPKYSLLREEFRFNRLGPIKSANESKQVLVTFGGTDPTNETMYVLNSLLEFAHLANTIIIVVGKNNPYIREIKDICSHTPNFKLHVQVSNMAQIMAESYFAICSGGTITWERYCMGLPALVITNASNQVEIAKTAHYYSFDKYLGHSGSVEKKEIQNAYIDALLNDEWILASSSKCVDIVDGLGVTRVLKCLFAV
ncbi:UDP-2,4-diacetamido-2,4,6-trideoxy-beta-L-altropyranose hydrolase [Paenibacillus planticolens]|uniref:UDP-2,4-diacetamido-2,4, 6-trideoxy-beta-L-altropyranose hydrolase n=1 Tax=Paenibacillus planticolens TaxID=2654976 RepID=A0ABX1ZPC8_9BACL|nr:UDP-2,4-diacetamido-2,4,6-trideoxy-beta-L-altropyranose hydrolase [Paenibacillus planticolens]NOV00465.1 UDP-2,4-diacetamido-2,4,6-trideoxy-beta-L-altropyranose hydrolase [Paenibacillus planticolens]